MSKLLVWDIPTRLFHWLLAAAFTAAYLLGEEEGKLGWHSYFGYLVGGLILFRLVWGFIGEPYSRFRAFPPNPAGALAYLRRLTKDGGERHLGHNPAGALAIYLLLFLGLGTVISGLALFGTEPGLGPLAGLVQAGWEEPLEEVHELFTHAMLAVVFLHLVGVAVGSLAHGENLPRSMLSGRKNGPADAPPARARPLAALALLLGLAWFTLQHDFSAGCDQDPARCMESRSDGDHDED